MGTNIRGLTRRAAIVASLVAAAIVGCGKPGNSEPSFRLNMQNQDPDEYRVVGYENEAEKKDKEFNERAQAYVVNALEALFGTPDRPYVFPESGLDLAKIFMASGPVGGLPQSEIDAQIMKFRQEEANIPRTKVEGLETAAKAAADELTRQQAPAKPIQARLTAAQTALADAEKAKNETAIAEQKRQIETIKAELKPFEEPIAKAQAAKTAADAELAKTKAQLDDLKRQVGVWNKGQLGLYRQHCSHCHGTTGDGAGPTALFLNPFPRDYRQGIFKFKSTQRSAKPSDADLRRILVDGIPDTAMPTVALLPPDQIDALVEYVKYLSMRGEAETAIRAKWIQDRSEMQPSRTELIAVALQPVVDGWKEAKDKVVNPVEPYHAAVDAWKKKVEEDAAAETAKSGNPVVAKTDTDAWLQSAAILFGGQKGQCYTCHGTTGLGDGRKRSEPLFDDWNKPKKFREFEPSLQAVRESIDKVKADDKLSGEDRAKAVAALNRKITNLTNLHNSWQLPEQQQFPRNLRLGRFRFGRAPLDIYRRIHEGITGTEMPGGGPAAPGQQGKLTTTEIWQLVDYVLLLPYLDPTNRLAPSAGSHAPPSAHAAAPSPHAPSQPAPSQHAPSQHGASRLAAAEER